MINENDSKIFKEICDDLQLAIVMIKQYNSYMQRLSAPDPQILAAKELVDKYKMDSSNVISKFGGVYLDGVDITNSVTPWKPPKLTWKSRLLLKIKKAFKWV